MYFFIVCNPGLFSFELFDFVKLTPTSCYCMNFIELHCSVSHTPREEPSELCGLYHQLVKDSTSVEFKGA